MRLDGSTQSDVLIDLDRMLRNVLIAPHPHPPCVHLDARFASLSEPSDAPRVLMVLCVDGK